MDLDTYRFGATVGITFRSAMGKDSFLDKPQQVLCKVTTNSVYIYI